MILFQLYQLPVQILYVLSVVCFKESFSIEGKYTKNVINYKIVYPVKVSGPDQSSRRYRRWEGDEEPTVHYQLNLGGNEEWIDLEPNLHILSPGAVLEHRTNYTLDNEPLANIQLEKPSYTQCFFRGKVRNYEDSSTALSTCGGLCGYIRVKRHTYFIEPVVNQPENETESEQQEQPHLLYEDEQPGVDVDSRNCATKFKRDTDRNHLEENSTTEETPNTSDKRLHIETLLVMDQAMMDMHEASDLQNYALTVFNMAQSLFHDLSTDPPIDLEIVRIIEIEDPNDILNFRQVRQLGTDQLKAFSGWQVKINPKDESHPNHHDMAVLLTGNEICGEEDSCHYVGVAEMSGTCQPKKQAAICKDTGLMLGYTIAHQIAHTLGVEHDPPERSTEGTSSVMSPVITLSPKVWSEQSRASLLSSINHQQLQCLEDVPDSEYEVPDMLPGVMYDADYQCRQLLTPDAKSCTEKGDCQSLSCEFEGASCSNTGIMPAAGTSCDLNKWCFGGVCMDAGKRPLSVDGNWGGWSDWSQCSRTCGAGVSMSTRECDSPSPKNGGKSCSGNRSRHKICTTEPCDVESQPFRDVQCSEYDDWVFPEDGEVHKWKGFFISNGNPCALYCRNNKDVVVSFSPKVKDGTTCYRGLRDICVDGICRDIPCDLQFDSNSVEDACGVCHGNGTSCEIEQGHKDFQEGLWQILRIPAGTRNIIVDENKPAPSHLIIKTEADEIINEGNKLGMFNLSGCMGWLGMKRPNQEIVEIPGPLVEPVEIWIKAECPQSVSYSMGLPSKPRNGEYSWDYLDWSACKAQCGDSFQESVPKCVELLSGHVEDKFCSQVDRPPIKKRSCNAGICLARWLIGEWQECGPCPSKEARRFRIVRCIKPIPGCEEGVVIISDKICPGTRPIGSEPCRCIKRQVLYWPSPYRFDMLTNDFKILPKLNKGNRTSKTPEKKVTLMQLENESEESMLKQFKENQQKHHSIFYMPRVLGSRFNFSIPFKKREAITNEISSPGSSPLFNSNYNFIEYFPRPNVIDLIKSGNRIMGTDHSLTTPPVKFFSLTDPKNNFNTIKDKRIKTVSTNDPQPLHFSDQNILKLLSENLPLDKLKQQHRMNYNKNPFSNLIYFPDVSSNDTGLSQSEKALSVIDILMNEFNNVLATNTLIASNTKKPHTTDSGILPLLSVAGKFNKGPIFENKIQFSRQPLVLANTSGLDSAITQLQNTKHINEIIKDPDSLKNLKLNNLGVNNQKATETWMPPTDHEWNKLLSEFKKYFIKKQCDSQLNADCKKTNDQLPQIENSIFFISTHPTITNVTSDLDLNPLGPLTRKVAEKLNTLNNRDKLKAYQLLKALVNNLYNTLAAFPQHQLAVYDELLDEVPSREVQLMPMRADNFEAEINKVKSDNFFNPLNDNAQRFNPNKNSVSNYSLPMFDKPIFSVQYLSKMKRIFNSDDNSNLNDNGEQKDNPEFYHTKRRNKQILALEESTEGNNKMPIETDQKLQSNTKSVVNHNLEDFITNFISDLHKVEKARNKKEAVQKLKAHHKVRFGRYIKQCIHTTTVGRRITGIYPIPSDRICPKSTTSSRPKFYLQRCKKNIANKPCEKIFSKDSVNRRALFILGNNKIIKEVGRKKRHKSSKPCEENSRICDELKRRFKDRLANVTKLDPYQCQRLREEIQHIRHNLKDEESLDKDLSEVINNNMTCIFRYSDEKDSTTPFRFG